MNRGIARGPLMNRFLVLFQAGAAAILIGAFAANIPAISPKVAEPIEPDGTLDLTFNAGEFTNGQVKTSALQPDGKVLIGGLFSKVQGVERVGIARLNTDGNLDSSFVPAAGIVFNAKKVILQPDGKIIVVATYSNVNLVRLNSDGSLDNTFNPDHTISIDGLDDGAGNATNRGEVKSALLQPDGKIVVVGRFFYILTEK
jgi:uncharacterized delta-60 repeat protein